MRKKIPFFVIFTIFLFFVSVVRADITSGVAGVVSSVSEGVSSAASTVADGVSSAASSVAEGVSSAASSVAEGVSSAASTVVEGVSNAASTAANVAADTVVSIVSPAADVAFRKILASLAKWAASASSSYASGGGFCWFCPIFTTLFDAMNTLATNVAVKLKDIFLATLGVGLLFFIAFRVGKMVVQLQEVDLMQFLGDLFKYLGRAIIASALLYSSIGIYQHLVSPMLQLSLELSSSLMEVGNFSDTNKMITSASQSGISVNPICTKEGQTADPSKQTTAFTTNVRNSLECFLIKASALFIVGMAIGLCIISLGFTALVFHVLPNVYYILLGFIIFVCFFAIYLAFPFKLMDAMIRLAFVCALTPLWIILWVFPATVGYTKKAWDMFLSACLMFLCLSIILIFISAMTNAALPNIDQVIQLMIQGQDKEAADLLPISGRDLLVTLAISYLAFKTLGTASALANSFIGAADLGLGNTMGQQARNLTVTAGKYTKSGYKLGKTATLGAIGAIGGALGRLRRKSPSLGKFESGTPSAPGAAPAAKYTPASEGMGGTPSGGYGMPASGGKGVPPFGGAPGSMPVPPFSGVRKQDQSPSGSKSSDTKSDTRGDGEQFPSNIPVSEGIISRPDSSVKSSKETKSTPSEKPENTNSKRQKGDIKSQETGNTRPLSSEWPTSARESSAMGSTSTPSVERSSSFSESAAGVSPSNPVESSTSSGAEMSHTDNTPTPTENIAQQPDSSVQENSAYPDSTLTPTENIAQQPDSSVQENGAYRDSDVKSSQSDKSDSSSENKEQSATKTREEEKEKESQNRSQIKKLEARIQELQTKINILRGSGSQTEQEARQMVEELRRQVDQLRRKG